jgi:pilus assembly protein CpaB
MEKKNTGFLVGLLMGVTVGLLAGGVGTGFAVYLKMKKVRRGWNLVPVLVATQQLPEGTVMTFNKLAQRNVPEQFVTPSVIKPDAVHSIIHHRLLVPVQERDMLRWSQFGTEKVAPATP